MRTIKKGATDQTVYVEILDSTSTTGGRKTGLVFNTASLTAYYVRNGGSATAITLATLAAANSAHSDGGFKEVDSTNMPGVYRLDLPDAAVASGAESVVVTVKGAADMAQVSLELQLVDNTPADVYGRIGAPAGASISADIAAVKTQTAAIETDTQDIQTRLPAALVSGRIDASVGAMAANVMTAAAAAADLTTELQSGLATQASVDTIDDFLDTEVAAILAAVDTEVAAIKAKTDSLTFSTANRVDAQLFGAEANTLTASALAADAVTEIQSGLATAAALSTVDDFLDTEIAAIKAKTDQLTFTVANSVDATATATIDPADIRDAVGLASANLDTQLGTIDTVVDAVKAKTDNLPASPAATGDAMALTGAAVDAIHDEAIDGAVTFRQSMRGQNAVLLGIASGLETTTAVYRDLADTKDRVSATVDVDGNRTAVTRDLT
jgi:hypothetical protein